MTKDKLQAELLEKVKEGVKPSDLKKMNKKQPKKSVLPSPIVQKDEGYSSDHSDLGIPTAPPLPNQDLINQINSLKKQLQIYQDFKEADLRIKEKYKQTIAQLQAKNQELTKTIQELKTQVKSTAINKEPKENTQSPKPPHLYLFTCDICEQTKKSQLHLGKVNGLGIDPHKENKICDHCIRKVDLIQPPREEFF